MTAIKEDKILITIQGCDLSVVLGKGWVGWPMVGWELTHGPTEAPKKKMFSRVLSQVWVGGRMGWSFRSLGHLGVRRIYENLWIG